MNKDKSLEYLKYTLENEKAIALSIECACIHCYLKCQSFEIIDYIWWENDNGEPSKIGSALCPHCKIDSIVPDKLILYSDLLIKEWHKQGFSNNKKHPGITYV